MNVNGPASVKVLEDNSFNIELLFVNQSSSRFTTQKKNCKCYFWKAFETKIDNGKEKLTAI